MKRRHAMSTAQPTLCNHGHSHPSKREAARCGELHMLYRAGEIDGLVVHPRYDFVFDGAPVMLANGQVAGYRADFAYLEKGRPVVEDVKPAHGWQGRDVPLRFALFRHLYPEIELRVVK